jgi:hypothetical protein
LINKEGCSNTNTSSSSSSKCLEFVFDFVFELVVHPINDQKGKDGSGDPNHENGITDPQLGIFIPQGFAQEEQVSHDGIFQVLIFFQDFIDTLLVGLKVHPIEIPKKE